MVLLCRFLALFHSLQRARNTAWAATCLFLGRFPALCFTPRWHQGCVQSSVPALAFKPCSSNGPLSHSRSQVSTFSVVCECTISVPPPGSSHHFATQTLSLLCFTSRKSATWVFHFAQFLCCGAYLSVFGATLSLRSVPRLGSFFFFSLFTIGFSFLSLYFAPSHVAPARAFSVEVVIHPVRPLCHRQPVQ